MSQARFLQVHDLECKVNGNGTARDCDCFLSKPLTGITTVSAYCAECVNLESEVKFLQSVRDSQASIIRKQMEESPKYNLKLQISEAEVERLRDGLENALEGLEEMFVYVPEYFRDKWEHIEYINRAKKILSGVDNQDKREVS